MKNAVFARRVCVLEMDCDRIAGYLSRKDAERQLSAQMIMIHEERNGQIVIVRGQYVHGELDAKPGSIGIDQEPLPTGHWVYQHNPTWDDVLLAA